MAGASVKITVRDQALQDAFRRLERKDGGLLAAALKNIGQQLVKSTRQRFADQRDPSGQPWAPLNPDYAAGKRGTMILQELGMRGGLLGSITAQAGPHRVAIGTNKVYGAIHQFGGIIVPRTGDHLIFRLGDRVVFARKVTIPARPYLDISGDDREEILRVIEDHIAEVWGSEDR